MLVIPSIDLKEGKCVKLVRGEVGTGITVSNDPVLLAKYWEEEGADLLHVVDLDGAIHGKRENWPIIKKIIEKVRTPVSVGGGLRTLSDIREVLNAGAKWAIIGTKIIEQKGFLERLIQEIRPSRIVVALDYRDGFVVIRGWRKITEMPVVKIVEELDTYGLAAYLMTDVKVEGTLTGVNCNFLKKLTKKVSTPILYAGGISSLDDLKKLKEAGVYGAVVGSAFYKGIFTLKDAKNLFKIRTNSR